MSTTKAKKEAKLKARKTSLSKKTNKELIDIILKKDNTERKNNDKIVMLRRSIDDLNIVINAKNEAIDGHEQLLHDAESEISNLNEDVRKRDERYLILEKDRDNLHTILASLKERLDSNAKDMKRVNIYKYSAIGFAVLLIILITSIIIF